MAIPTTEIIFLPPTAAFIANPSIVYPAFDIVLKTEGLIAPVYHGLQIEPNAAGQTDGAFFFLNWETLDHHAALMKAANYPTLISHLLPAFDGETKMYHVKFSDLPVALEKPVTEILVLTLNAEENRAKVVEILSKISEASEKMLVFGETVEDKNKIILIGGWVSVEAHWEMVKKPEVKAALDLLYSLANKELIVHTKLTKYSGN
ncbi:hypothetical protein BJ138DRAFT_582259 [Hygrophoropsis aurantiaca]|uniref:Uncharacterized protein n=1 Tax=Hygrophoropsis aurantiaca TaxID=72124 RepID=A0ACB8AJS9_9AGAM|nr:hypothetical protein BJ138DRAFT_582259 [Hygrophoropsis aurantiaca]